MLSLRSFLYLTTVVFFHKEQERCNLGVIGFNSFIISNRNNGLSNRGVIVSSLMKTTVQSSVIVTSTVIRHAQKDDDFNVNGYNVKKLSSIPPQILGMGGEKNDLREQISSLYSSDELQSLLDIHNTVGNKVTDPISIDNQQQQLQDKSSISSLHDLITQEISVQGQNDDVENDNDTNPYASILADMRQTINENVVVVTENDNSKKYARDSNPFASILEEKSKYVNKYSPDELQSLLDIHNTAGSKLMNQQQLQQSQDSKSTLSLHDMITQEIETKGNNDVNDGGEDIMNCNINDENPFASLLAEARENLIDVSVINDVNNNDSNSNNSFASILAEMRQDLAANNNNKQKYDETTLAFPTPISSDIVQKISQINSIASDIDGTILDKTQTVHPKTRDAIIRSIEMASSSSSSSPPFFFFPATGKSRKGALDSLGELGKIINDNKSIPGVYCQGLYCIDGNDDVVFEQRLSSQATSAAVDLACEFNVSIVAYDGDNFYTNILSEEVIELHKTYGEPMSQLKTPMELRQHTNGYHKILFMSNSKNVTAIEELNQNIRAQLEIIAQDNSACVTQAIPTMLEYLPEGCSKAHGVKELCKHLGIDPTTQLLALGDAENDAEMLEMASIGVAMGNGCPMAKDSADYIMGITNSEGAAGAAIKKFAPFTNL